MMHTVYQHGLIVGKFMPLHKGHLFLIEAAQSQAELLTIVLISLPDDPIPGPMRLLWLTQTVPGVSIVYHDAVLPKDESGFGHWDDWSESIRAAVPTSIDVVFSSEDYGVRLAKDCNAAHVLVDKARSAVPVSATQIRADPKQYADFLPEPVRLYFGV